ncbi:MAG: NACHT domain-containing protein [Planctomycetes bacterium]|nr:NACHT domain-containing protein [Planctomycetota bacterium]
MTKDFPQPAPGEAVWIVEPISGSAQRVRLRVRVAGAPEVLGELEVDEDLDAQELTALLRAEESHAVYTALAAGLAPRPQAGWSRVVLAVDPAHAAAGLPWEGIDVEGGQPFLDGRCALVRTWPSAGPARPSIVMPEGEPLRALVVLGDVEQQRREGRDPVATTVTAEGAREVLSSTVAGLAKLAPHVRVWACAPGWSRASLAAEPVGVSDLDELRAWLRGEREVVGGFDVVAFVGHSNHGEKPATALKLCFGKKTPEYPLSDLAADLRATRSRLLVLYACELASSAIHALAASVGEVLAWTVPVPVAACCAANGPLFEALAASPPARVSEAVRAARRWLYLRHPAVADRWVHQVRDAGVPAFVDPARSDFAGYRDTVRARLLLLPEALERYAGRAQVLQELYVELSVERGRNAEHAGFWRLLDPTGPRPLRHWIEHPPEQRCFVLAGEPGAGKSTLLRHLAVELLEAGWLAVYVPVQALLDAGIQRVDDLARLAGHASELIAFGFLTTERVDRARTTGRFALLLDGLDEVGDRKAGEALITLLVAQLGAGRLAVASRTDGLREFDNRFLVAHVCDLDDDGQRALARKWFAVLLQNPGVFAEMRWLRRPRTDARDPLEAACSELDRLLERRRPLALVCRNPLALTLCVLRIAAGGPAGIPASRYGILGWLCDFLLECRHRDDRPFDAPALPRRLLGHLALFLLERGTVSGALLQSDRSWSALGRDFLASLPEDLREAELGGPVDEGGKLWCVDDPTAWVFSRKPAAAARTLADRLRSAGLIEPLNLSVDCYQLRFPILSLADFLAADCLREQFEGDLAGLGTWLRKRRQRIESNLARWSEMLALCAGWQGERSGQWLRDLAALDPRLGLRALGHADDPPVEVFVELLSRARHREKQNFWDGFARPSGSNPVTMPSGRST